MRRALQLFNTAIVRLTRLVNTLIHPKADTFSYRGWLVSDRFYKRLLAFAVYLFLASLLITLIKRVFLDAVVLTLLSVFGVR